MGKAAVEVEERPELANRHQSLRSLLHNNIIKTPPQHQRLLKSPPQQHHHLKSISSNLLHNTIVSSNLSPEPPQHHYFAKSIQSPQYESILQNILHVPTTSLLTKFLQAPRLASSREISLQSPHNGTFHSFIQAQRWSREISFKTQQQDHSFNSFQKLPKSASTGYMTTSGRRPQSKIHICLNSGVLISETAVYSWEKANSVCKITHFV